MTRPLVAGSRSGSSRRRIVRRAAYALAAFAGLWSLVDVASARRTNFREFDTVAMGRLDAAMWRSYYERRPVRLFWQLARSLRVQFHTGFWRSFPMAYRAARAAFVFKDGRSREDYARALPDLEQYFASISGIAKEPFDPRLAARDELEWWIIRREPADHTTAEWERLIAAVAAEIYHRPADRFATYARLRVKAMVLRDQQGARITEADWEGIAHLLEESWSALGAAVRSA